MKNDSFVISQNADNESLICQRENDSDGSITFVQHELRWSDNPNQPYTSHRRPYRDRYLLTIPAEKLESFIKWLRG